MTGPRRPRQRPVGPPSPTAAAPAEPPDRRSFTLGQVLTIACADLGAQQLFCTWGEFLDVVGYLLAGIPLLDHIENAVEQRARPAVLAQHPALADAVPPDPLGPDVEVLTWLAEQETRHGARLILRPEAAA